ncbi:MAG TPA: DUF1570 domain-containing protein [Planctomycetota bacterium]|nr:DUF1570 domain-containing protein [Planctomycetota bacterium]
MQARKTLGLAIAWTALSLVAAADRIVTTDGRVIEVKKARTEGNGYKLTFEHGEITLADKSAVKAVEVEGDMSDYVPKDETEKANLAKGFVKYGGAWMTKAAYENKLAEEHAKSQKRTEDMAAHADFDHGWTKETQHFALRTNSSAELLDYYGDLLERYYSLMDDRFGINPSPSLRRTKMQVNIYKNRKEFTKYSGMAAGVAGFFSPSDQTLNFYHDYNEPEISNWVCLHECTHLLTFLIDPQYVSQIWVNEGVADFFGSAEILNDLKKDKITITPGRLQTDRVLTVQQAITDKKDIKLEDLFKITRDEFEAFQYAHAWSFVYFLNQTPKYKKGFDKFFKDLYSLAKGIEFENVSYASFAGGRGKQVKPEEIRRVLLHSLGVKDTASLEKEWKDFIAKVPIEAPAARFKRAYMMVMQTGISSQAKDPAVRKEETQKNVEMVIADLDAAIGSGIKDPRAYYARYMVRMMVGAGLRGESADAMKEDLSKAIELDPLNAVYRFAMGNLLAKDMFFDFGEAGSIDVSNGKKSEVVPEAAALLGLAVELAPENESYLKRYESYVGSK